MACLRTSAAICVAMLIWRLQSNTVARVTSLQVLGPAPQGTWMGIINSFGSLARTIGPVIISNAYQIGGPLYTYTASTGIVRQLRHYVGPRLASFSATHYSTHAVCDALLSAHACRTLIGACNPMLCPILCL